MLFRSSLRADPPKKIAGQAVTDVVDYLHGTTGLLPSDVLAFRLAGEGKLIVRPSGTEPKLKLYLSVRGGSREEAGAMLAALEQAAGELMERKR